MLRKKKIAITALLAVMLVFSSLALSFFFAGRNKIAYATSAIAEGEGVTVTGNVSDAYDETKKGVSVKATASGTTAKLGAGFTGDFVIDLKAKGEKGEVPDLKSFSLVFTERETKDSFALKVAYSKEKMKLSSGGKAENYLVTDLSVVYGGERAGIYYRETNSMPYELTSGYNAQSKHTRFYYGENAVITFNAKELVLKVNDKTAKNQNYVLKIWDFKKEINDGKKLKNDLDSFFNYDVSIVFDEIAAGKAGELVIYAFSDGENDYVFDDDKATIISAEVGKNAIVGQEYSIPEAVVTKVVKDDKNAKATVSVTCNGANVTVNDGKFTADKVGDYVIKYTYEEDGQTLATKEYKIKAVASVTNEIVLSSDFPNARAGLNDTLYIPAAALKSNLDVSGRNLPIAVKITKGGETLKEESAGGFDYRFTATGDYEITYANAEYGFNKTYTVTVSADELGIVKPTISETYALGETFKAEPLKAYVGGEEIISTVTLKYPSGRTSASEISVLDELGNYVLSYSFTADGEVMTIENGFVVEKPLESLFDYTDATLNYGVSTYNCNLDGALFTVKNSAVITYSEVVDVKNMFFDDSDTYANKNDESKYAPLIEIAAVPSLMGSADLTTIFVTLTDVEDESNTMSIRLRLAEAGSSLTKIRAKGKNQTYTGQNFKWNSTYTGIDSYVVENAAAHEFGGFSSSHNFTQAAGSNKTFDSTCKLYYDYEKNAIYSKPAYEKLGQEELSWLVCDFDDDRFFGTPWTGFRKGLAKLSVSFAGVEGSADILIRSVNGEKIEGNLIDDEIKPTITFDFGGDETAPLGEVGTEYRIPDCVAKDNSGIISETSYKVFYGDKEVVVSNGKFTPEATGYYKIEYSAKDSFGNLCVENVAVRVMSYVTKPILETEGDLPPTANYGEAITLPDFSAKGGAGYNEKSISVVCGDKTVEIKDGKFVCDEAGDYTVTLKVTDYLGKTAEKVYFIAVEYKNAPSFNAEEITLPSAFISGEEFTFGKYYADYYASEGSSPEKIAAKIIVSENGMETEVGKDGKYTPSESEDATEATVKFVFEKENAETYIAKRKVPITHIAEKAGFMERFFVTENAEVSSSSTEVAFTAAKSGEKLSASFIKPVYKDNLSVDLKIFEKNYNGIIVEFTDSKNSAQKAEIEYVFADGKVYAVINGEKREVYIKDGILGVDLDAATFDVTDKNEVWAGKITDNKNGSKFVGFDSGYAYVTVTVKNVAEGSTIGISQIADQNFNYLGFDLVNPTLKVNGNLSGKVGINSTITTPSAFAYDTLFAIKSLTITVIDPNEEIVFEGDASRSYNVTLGKYGTYQFIYQATDASRRGNSTPITKTITVYDPTAPTLEFDREMITEITVGYKYVLPAYTVKDNAPPENSTVHITVINPRGLADTVTDGTVKFLYKGTYKITYFVIDADGNNNLYSFAITAKEA